jgi:hypothetical protein
MGVLNYNIPQLIPIIQNSQSRIQEPEAQSLLPSTASRTWQGQAETAFRIHTTKTEFSVPTGLLAAPRLRDLPPSLEGITTAGEGVEGGIT